MFDIWGFCCLREPVVWFSVSFLYNSYSQITLTWGLVYSGIRKVLWFSGLFHVHLHFGRGLGHSGFISDFRLTTSRKSCYSLNSHPCLNQTFKGRQALRYILCCKHSLLVEITQVLVDNSLLFTFQGHYLSKCVTYRNTKCNILYREDHPLETCSTCTLVVVFFFLLSWGRKMCPVNISLAALLNIDIKMYETYYKTLLMLWVCLQLEGCCCLEYAGRNKARSVSLLYCHKYPNCQA